MPSPKLNALTTSLRNGGVSSAYINRLVAELDDHYADLEHEERATGREPAAAAVEALRRLGRQDTIAAEVLAKPELRSWPYRWPWIVRLLRPVLLLLLLPAVPVLACAGRGPAIARWSASISLGVVLTGGLLLAMAESILSAI
ncbi:MAG: hypothetical protein V3S67_01495 [Gammaproteobacteria bacterium]